MTKLETDLKKVGELMVKELVQELISQNKVASSELVKSIKYDITVNSNEIEVAVYGVDYAKWVNVGRRKQSKKVPISALLKWIEIKGLASGDKETRSLAFAIQTNIWKNGIKPTRFIENAEQKFKNEIETLVLNAIGLKMSNEIDKSIKKYWDNKAEVVI